MRTEICNSLQLLIVEIYFSLFLHTCNIRGDFVSMVKPYRPQIFMLSYMVLRTYGYVHHLQYKSIMQNHIRDQSKQILTQRKVASLLWQQPDLLVPAPYFA